jgi:hypothetical protein
VLLGLALGDRVLVGKVWLPAKSAKESIIKKHHWRAANNLLVSIKMVIMLKHPI